MSTLLTPMAFALSMALNTVSSCVAYKGTVTNEKDLMLPFSVMIFLFYPLLIYLPETHYKVVTFGEPSNFSVEIAETDEEEKFPFAFLFTLISITLSIILHRLVIWESSIEMEDLVSNKNETHQELPNNREVIKEYRAESQVLKYYLSIALGLLNITNSFYITNGQSSQILRNEFIIFILFSIIIHFAYGYLNRWSMVSSELNQKLSIFVNFGNLLGYLLGLIVEDNLLILILPCLSCGLMIYCSTLVCMPAVFSNGENHTQDKLRYFSIFISLLVTVVYHPFCYLLRV